ncbi:MAG: 2-isopropylmalate synthase [Eubacteriales bacterium]|nr:2-isopropylmalate synthase [Eubacteriales bacterium]
MSRNIRIFDTTLRDGEQAPGCSMNLDEKLELAHMLEALKVDAVEAGFAVASPGDFESVRQIALRLKNTAVASLCRAVPGDVETGWEAVKGAAHPMLHVFIATSDVHMKYKLKMPPERVLELTGEMVRKARGLCGEVEFSAEDATRSDRAFLCRVLDAAAKAGASTINVPDTVGYATPTEMAQLIAYLRENMEYAHKVRFSVHCHNDLGMAVANSLSAVQAGVDQVECTLGGIGERAGNASLEEIVMALRTRGDYFGAGCGVDTRQLFPACNMVSRFIGQHIPANKPIVGANAFAHESGIHMHGVMSNRNTYEIMKPEDIGITQNTMVIGKHSGKHAIEEYVRQMGMEMDAAQLANLTEEIKRLADVKNSVDRRDVEALIAAHRQPEYEDYALQRFIVNSGTSIPATSVVQVTHHEQEMKEVSMGDGPIDAAFGAINRLTGRDFALESYRIQSATEGGDALGVVDVRIRDGERSQRGRGTSTDIIDASIRAYLDAVNRFLAKERKA